MTKSELAQKYLPDLTERSAVNRMMAWINASEPLLQKLQATGYNKKQRIFTALQVKLIFEYLGEP